MKDKTERIRRLRALIENPGTPEEGKVAESILKKILDKENSHDGSEKKPHFFYKIRCDKCAHAWKVDFNGIINVVCKGGGLENSFGVTNFYQNGESPPHCPATEIQKRWDMYQTSGGM